MRAFNSIEKAELRDLLGKSWLTHDGMWFYHTYQEFGIERANILNRAAIKSLAPIEIERVRKILGAGEKEIANFEMLRDFMHNAFELILPDSVYKKFRFGPGSKNILCWEWEKEECFAFKGMTQMGIIDQYHCGVMYRVECWLKSLGINYTIAPRIDKCIMHATGTCTGEIRLFNDK